MTLQDRLSRIEDLQAIRDVIAEVNWVADHNQIDRVLDHLVEDVVLDVGEFGLYRGKAAVGDFYNRMMATFALRIHNISNQIIELDGTRAHSKCYWQAALEWQGRALIGAGTYHDELIKHEGRWLLATRTARVIYLSPLDEGWAKTRLVKLE